MGDSETCHPYSRFRLESPKFPPMPRLEADLWIRRLEWGLLTVGIGLRTARYLEARPLWIDEVFIALNVLPNGPADFLQPIGWTQISPLGFLISEWLVTRVAGGGESALRFLPFVASIVGLILFNRFARRALDRGPALLATALAAFSPLLINYAAEVKSYAFDWLCTVLLMQATLSLAEQATPRAWVRWSLAAAFGSLMSTPAPFFVAGCALALLTVPATRTPRALLRLGAATAPAALLFVLQYFTTYDSSSTQTAMEAFWSQQFLDMRLPDALVQAAQLTRTFIINAMFGERVAELMPRKSMTIIMIVTVLGAALLVRRHRLVGVMVIAPVLFAATASMLHRWPLAARLLLFLMPALVMAMAFGIAALTQLVPIRFRSAALATVSILLVASVAAGVRWKWNENLLVFALPEAFRSIIQNREPNATVYLSADLVPGCRYYLGWHPDQVELGGKPRVAGAARDTTSTCVLRDGTTLPGRWPFFLEQSPSTPANTPLQLHPEWLDAEAARIVAATSNEVWLVLGNRRALQESFAGWFERHGWRRISEQRRRALLVTRYVKPS